MTADDIIKYGVYLLMGLLSFLSLRLWNDVQELKKDHITKEDLDAFKAESKTERDAKHVENTGNFRRLEDKIDGNSKEWNKDYREFSGALTDIRVRLAEQGSSLKVERRHRDQAEG